MEVICLEYLAFYTLIEKVIDRLKEKDQDHEKWELTLEKLFLEHRMNKRRER